MSGDWLVILFLLAFAVGFYALGANAVEGFVNYPSWRLIPAAAFQDFHRYVDRVVPLYVVLPTAIWTVLTAVAILVAPSTIPRWEIITALVLQFVGWVTSFAIDVPIQMSLSKEGWSTEKVGRLIWTDRLLRQLPALVAALLFLWMMGQATQI